MGTKLEITQLEQGALSERKHFIQAFVENLGDPENYDFTGEVVEARGYCICGHPIAYQFGIKHKVTGREAWVGSVCINNFQQYNLATYEALVKALEKVQEKLKALKKAQKQALQDKEIEGLTGKYKEVFDKVYALATRFRAQGVWLPYSIFLVVSKRVGKIKSYTRKGDYIKAYKKAIDVCEKALENSETKEQILKLKY